MIKKLSVWVVVTCLAGAASAGPAGLGSVSDAVSAAADVQPETVVGVHLGTYHDSRGLNDFNPGLFIERGSWTAGVYHNSIRKTSIYAGWTWQSQDEILPGVRPFATVGLVSGYVDRHKRDRILPLLAPGLRLELSPESAIRATVLPRIKGINDVTALHLTYERRVLTF